MKRVRHGIAALGVAGMLVCAGSVPARAQAEDPRAYGDDYATGDFGRVMHEENGATLRRGYDDPTLSAVAEVTSNAPVFPGDTLITDPEQRVEVQLASGTMVRIDGATELTFLSLPDPYAEYRDNSVLQLAEGSVRISTRVGEGEEFRVDTPGASIYFLADGDFRVEVEPSGRTEVLSRRGVAEVVGNGGSVLLRAGTRTEVLPQTVPEEAWAYNTFVGDEFDRWVDQRDAFYQGQTRYEGTTADSEEVYEAVPQEVQPYYRELNHYGSWAWDGDYGYVWYPRTVAPGWSPYYDGYWAYGPGGYFWVSYEPWGWAPYHYGRWAWVGGYGWGWIPGQVFAGAWVAWSWGSAYVGWAPLDYWGRPCYANNLYYGYYDPYAWSFVHYDHITHHDHARYAVRIDDTGDHARNATVVSRAPRIPPTELARSPAARQAAVREARGDQAAAMRQVSTTSRPARTFREQERDLPQRSAAAAPTAQRLGSRSVMGRGGAPSGVTGQQSASPPARGGAQGNATRGDRSAFPAYPRRMASDPAAGPAGRGSAPRTQAGAPSGRTAMPPVRPREGSGSGIEQRVRDLYRRMANPRATPQESGAVQPRRTQGDSRETTSKPDERSGSRPAPSAPPKAREDTRDRPQAGSPQRAGTKEGEARRNSTPEKREQPAPSERPRERREERANPGRASASSASANPSARMSGASSPLRERQAASAAPQSPRPSAPTMRGGSRVDRGPARPQAAPSRPSTQRASAPSAAPWRPAAASAGSASRTPSTGARPSGGGGSRPSAGARPSGGGGSRPSAGARPSGGGGSRPGAGARPSGGGGSRPGAGARPSGGGGSRPSGSPARSSQPRGSGKRG